MRGILKFSWIPFINFEEENGYEEKEEVVEGMNVHLSEDKEVISVCSQQLSIVVAWP